MPNVKSKELKAFILTNIAKGATMVTDEAPAYKGIAKQGYKHETVNHKSGEYYRAGFHTNGIENFWSQFKRGIIGIYHQVSVKHIDRYCDEFAYRQNNRKVADPERVFNALANSAGRLKYADLIANTNTTNDFIKFRPE